jgi:hypothetical protein
MAPTIATPPPDAAVRALLADLGLAHLIGVFAEHEVDDAAFLQLKDGDLRDINISRGNRRKILTAIQTIKEQERQWAPSIVTPPPSPVTECGICMDASVEVRVVGCGHTMCSSCAAGWFARTPAGQVTECPTCRGPCTDFEPLVPPVPIVESAVEFPRHQIFVGKAYDMTTPQLVHLFKGVGRVVDAFIMTDSAGRSKGCGMVEFSEPEAVARAIEVWRQKRHPRWTKLIVERVRRARFADAAASKRAVVAGTRARAASVERADAASEALVRAEAAEARVAGVEAQVVAAEARAAAAETRARAAEARVAAAEARAVTAQEDRVRAYVTATELQVANSGLLAKLDASEAAAAAATARAAETEAARESLESQLKDCVGVFHATATAESVMSPGEDLPDPDYPSPPYEPLPMPLAYVPGVSPLVLGPVAPGPLPWSWAPLLQLGGTPPPDTIFQGTVIDFGPKGDSTGKRRYGFIRVDHTQSRVFVRSKDAPDGYLSEGDRCEFRIVECRNRSNSQKGTLQWKAVDVVCVQRASPVPETPQPSC